MLNSVYPEANWSGSILFVKGRAYPGSGGPELRDQNIVLKVKNYQNETQGILCNKGIHIFTLGCTILI